MGYETKKQNVPEGFTHLGEEMKSVHGMFADDATESKSKSEPKIHYPEIHFDGEHAAHLSKHLSKHGTAHIHFKKVSESTHHSTHADGKEKTHHRIGIQIHGIKAITEPQSEKKMDRKINPEDSIEKGLEAAESEANS